MAMTVAEIGRVAGCSSATVSRALNNSGSVSPKTRQTVLKALQEVRYQSKRGKVNGRIASSRVATARRDSGTLLVEVVLHRASPMEQVSFDSGRVEVGQLSDCPEGRMLSPAYQLTNSFYREIIDGAVGELARWNHRGVLQVTSNLLDAEFLAETNRPDRRGVLLIGEESPHLPQFIGHCFHPLVLVDIIHDGWPDVVTTDNFVGISRAFDHIFGLGHRRIGFVGTYAEVPAFMERFLGFKLKMVEAGLTPEEAWIYRGTPHIEQTAAAVAQMLRGPWRPTALLCATDCHALGVMRAAASVGMSIPGELSVMGFDDAEMSALLTPPLSSMRVAAKEMGRQAVRQLMIQIQGGAATEKGHGCRIRLLPELVVRSSTASPGA